MGHDVHFLSRLERVSLPHVELALSLYRDTQLLRFILDSARIAERAERVAISLEDPVRGPFIIVTRDGRFVTCLGKDMSPGELPVITRAQLDGLSHKAQALRARMEMAERLIGPHGQVSQLVRRIVEAGDEMTREEFIALSAWAPLLRTEFLSVLFEIGTHITSLRKKLRTDRRPRPQDEPLLRTCWNGFWAMGHLALLVALDGREMLEALPPELHEVRGHLSWGLVRQGVLSLALRGAWAVGKLGKAALPAYKQGYARARSPLQAINTGMGLVALAARHSRLRAEAHKALSFDFTGPDAPHPQIQAAMRAIEELLAALFTDMQENFEALELTQRLIGGALFRRLVPAPPGSPFHFNEPEEVPEPLALATAASMRLDFLNHHKALIQMLCLVPWVARAKAEDFYFPGELMPLLHERWRPEHTLELLGGQQQYYGKRRPHRAEAKPGRNDPCSCGSGKKYKLCCGA